MVCIRRRGATLRDHCDAIAASMGRFPLLQYGGVLRREHWSACGGALATVLAFPLVFCWSGCTTHLSEAEQALLVRERRNLKWSLMELAIASDDSSSEASVVDVMRQVRQTHGPGILRSVVDGSMYWANPSASKWKAIGTDTAPPDEVALFVEVSAIRLRNGNRYLAVTFSGELRSLQTRPPFGVRCPLDVSGDLHEQDSVK